jgi:hypothetical protein
MSKGFSKEAEGAAVERGVGGNDVLDTWELCRNGGEEEERQDKRCVDARHGRDDSPSCCARRTLALRGLSAVHVR